MRKSKKKETTIRITPEWLIEQPIDIQMEALNSCMTIYQMVVNGIMNNEANYYAGTKYSHDKPYDGEYDRWGHNPSSIKVGSQRLKIDVPRIRNKKTKKMQTLESVTELRKLPGVSEQIVKGVINGLSTRKYGEVIDTLQEGFGLSKSSVSRKFIEGSKERVKEFLESSLKDQEIVAIFMDGKYMRTDQVIIALGVLSNGYKIPLGFIQSHTENHKPIRDFLNTLIDRGLKYKQGLLWIVDGSTGMHKAIKTTFGKYAIIQRCIFHKLQNIKSYIAEKYHEKIEEDYFKALKEPTYASARIALKYLKKYLNSLNIAAANSLDEAFNELLTLHKLGVNKELSKSLRTTNCIESLNSTVQKYVGKIKIFESSQQRYRWTALALIEATHSLRRIRGYKNIDKLQKALTKFVKYAK
jgi:putative transposase